MALGPFYVAEMLRKTGGPRGVILLMRHGETSWNREGRVMGQNPVELDAAGCAQVEAAIPTARQIRPEFIVSSPLMRARQSAEIIAKGVGRIEVSEDPDLSEVRYGRWEGMVFDELIDDPDYIRYRERPIETATPGGETIAQVQSRGVAAVMRALAANPDRRILFVSHGDIIKTVLCHFMRVPLENFRSVRVDNAAFFGLQVAGEFAEVKFLNLLHDPARAFTAPFRSKRASE